MDILKKSIDILIFENMNLLDVAGPAEAFNVSSRFSSTPYQLRFVSADGEPVTCSCGLKLVADTRADLNSPSQSLIVPGGNGVDAMLDNPKAKQLIQHWLISKPDGRLISICSGALLLASAGVLNGKIATTHWSRERQVRTQYPKVEWKLNALYLNSGSIYSSAGVTTGIDLSLSIIRADCGAETALKVARELVVYLQRSGGQSQYSDILETQFSSSDVLSMLIEKLIAYPERNWTLETMAESIALTPRTLSRRFNTELGCSPVRYLEKLRVKSASDAIAGGMTATQATTLFGFGDIQRMQRTFKRHLGTSVGTYQKRFS